jgi:hypothetical protein
MPPPVVFASSPVQFILERRGGAAIWASVSVWSGVGTASEKRVDVIKLDDNLDEVATISRSLPPGNYACVFKVFVTKDLNGKFGYRHRIGSQPVFEDQGVAGEGGDLPDGGGFRDEYVLAVQA